ncbi:hypothetical protein Vi05172_g4858 [Venturia inaequalis]|nr:hypothetical protein Vi05172_g4858 [Venturia inaequalis]
MSLCWDCLIAEYAIRIPQDGSGLGRGVWGAVFSERVNSCRDAGHGMKFLPGSVVLNQTLVSKGASTSAPTSTSTSELKPASVNLTRATSKAPSNRPSSTNPMVPYTVTAGANRTLATKFPKTMSLKMSISTANVSAAATYHRDTTTFRAVIVIESTTRTSYVSATTAGPTSARKANAASRLINFPRFNLWAETGVSLLSLRWWAGVLTKYVPSATAIDYVPSATNTTSDKSSYSSLAASARFPANGLAVSVCLAMTVCCGSTFDMSRICHRDCQCICESGMFPLLEQQ